MQNNNKKIKWLDTMVSRERSKSLNGHRGAVLWFTGVSGSDKSTLSNAVEQRLHQLGYRTFLFDGDNIRHGLCKDSGFSHEESTGNTYRIGEVANFLSMQMWS